MYQRVTKIGDLPELSDVESGIGGGQPPHSMHLHPSSHSADQFQKHIRQRHIPSPQAGMEPMRMQQAPLPSPPPVENFTPRYKEISCLEIADHVKECPICSKFYNNDKTIYVIVIVVLAVMCLLLLKKVLDV